MLDIDNLWVNVAKGNSLGYQNGYKYINDSQQVLWILISIFIYISNDVLKYHWYFIDCSRSEKDRSNYWEIKAT